VPGTPPFIIPLSLIIADPMLVSRFMVLGVLMLVVMPLLLLLPMIMLVYTLGLVLMIMVMFCLLAAPFLTVVDYSGKRNVGVQLTLDSSVKCAGPSSPSSRRVQFLAPPPEAVPPLAATRSWTLAVAISWRRPEEVTAFRLVPPRTICGSTTPRDRARPTAAIAPCGIVLRARGRRACLKRNWLFSAAADSASPPLLLAGHRGCQAGSSASRARARAAAAHPHVGHFVEDAAMLSASGVLLGG
jgi:hypothetical protein